LLEIIFGVFLVETVTDALFAGADVVFAAAATAAAAAAS